MPLATRRLYLFDAVTDKSANALVREIHDLERLAPATPIELYVNSDGGGLVAGLSVVDTMRQITSPVHTICVGRCRSVAAAILAAGEPGHRGVSVSARVGINEPSCEGDSATPTGPGQFTCELLAQKFAACQRKRQIWLSALSSLSGQSPESWNDTFQKSYPTEEIGIFGHGEEFDADAAVELRLADFVLEGPAAVGLRRTDPEETVAPKRMYTGIWDGEYDSASGAEEHEEAHAA